MSSNRQPPKNYKNARKPMYSLICFKGKPWDEFIGYIEEVLEEISDAGGIEPVIDVEVPWGDYAEDEISIDYFAPMSEEEIKRWEKKSRQSKEAAKKRKEKQLEKERAEYERLKAKFADPNELLY